MGIITKTLGEILDIPGYQLFLPHDIVDYEHLQDLVIAKFYNREIAYDTVDYFRMKFNYVLEINAPIYNKMLNSEYIEINPFETDYRESTSASSEAVGEATTQSEFTGTRQNQFTAGNTKAGENTNYIGKSNSNTENNAVGTDFTGRLYSQADNKAVDRQYKERKDYVDTTDSTDKKVRERSYEETTDQHVDTDHTVQRDTDRDVNQTVDRNQTGRNWTERGTSKAHNLDVDSDTPQAMLFNVPNHYMGTGTADDFGKVVNTTDGQAYEHYLEDDIAQLDSKARTINGGDTPWFNYASGATNRLGHDNYERSGNETFTQNDKNVTSDNTGMHEDGTKHTDSNTVTTGSEHITDDNTFHEDVKGNHDITDNETTLDSTTSNSNEHTKSDTIKRDNGQTTARDAHQNLVARNTDNVGAMKSNSAKDSAMNKSTALTRQTAQTGGFKGRIGRSPSQLLKQYRETLTYSADMYMIAELEKCFLDIY